MLEIEEHMYDPIQKSEFDNQSKEFSVFAKQMLPFLKNLQKEVSAMMINTS